MDVNLQIVGIFYNSTVSVTTSDPTVYDQDVRGRVLQGATYPPGEYFLAEHLSSRPAYTVWQYYMFDAAGRYMNPERKATPFGEQPLTGVAYGDGSGTGDVARVTWRLVSILGQPTTPKMTNSEALISLGSPPPFRES